jgi:hypothetical protein
VVLVRDSLKQCANARSIIVQPEIGRGEQRGILTTTLEQVRQDSDQIARFLRVGSDEHCSSSKRSKCGA